MIETTAVGVEGSPITFNGSLSTDVDGDSLKYSWTFGDGASAPGRLPQHAFADEGSYVTTLTVTDEAGLTDTASRRVTITNALPAIDQIVTPLEQAMGSQVVVRVLAHDAGTADTVTLIVDWGDQTRDSIENTSLLYHTYTRPGSYRLQVTVRDNDGGEVSQSAVAPIAVFDPAVGRAPHADAGGPYEGLEAGIVQLNARGSSDPDGDSLSYKWDLGGPATIFGSITGPSPSAIYYNDDVYTATVIVTDRSGLADTAMALVTVRNVAPRIQALTSSPAQAVGIPALIRLWLWDGAYTLSSDTLTAIIDWGDGSTTNSRVESTINSRIDSAAHTYSAVGSYHVRVRVVDGDGGEVADSTIIPVLDPAARKTFGPYETVDLGTLGGDETWPYDINDHAQIVGYSLTSTRERHAFVWEEGQLHDLGVLGQGGTSAQRINENGIIAGAVFPTTDWWDTAPAVWTNGIGQAFGRASESDWARPVAIGASGAVLFNIGHYLSGHAELWRNGTRMDLGDLKSGPRHTIATGMNEGGQIIGSSYNGDIAGSMDGYYTRAWVWEAGVMRDLGVLGSFECFNAPGQMCTHSAALDINERGQVVGWSVDTAGEKRVVLWNAGTIRDLGLAAGYPWIVVINDRGQVAGATGQYANGIWYTESFFWSNGTLRSLGSLGGGRTQVTAINESGLVVGTSRTAAGEQHVFVWSEQEGMIDLGTGPHGFSTATAVGINARGDVIGSTTGVRAILWRRTP